MAQKVRWTIHDLEDYPVVEGERYEIIDGQLHVTTQPSLGHQRTCSRLHSALSNWNDEGGGGEVVFAPGVIFDIENAVAPDLIWIGRSRLDLLLASDGKLHDAPDLVIEVLSPGSRNQRRDRQIKLYLYDERGVREYWIVNWIRRQIEVYRRTNGKLETAGTMLERDTLESPMLPGFSFSLQQLFADLSPHPAEPQI